MKLSVYTKDRLLYESDVKAISYVNGMVCLCSSKDGEIYTRTFTKESIEEYIVVIH